MPIPRGLASRALIASAIALIVCSVSWGALGVVALVPTVTIDSELYRYLTTLLATMTVCSVIANLTARVLRDILAAIATTTAEHASDEGYADGYADGLAAQPASPAVSRLVPARR